MCSLADLKGFLKNIGGRMLIWVQINELAKMKCLKINNNRELFKKVYEKDP